jgi:hypothetical protein
MVGTNHVSAGSKRKRAASQGATNSDHTESETIEDQIYEQNNKVLIYSQILIYPLLVSY